MKLLIIRHAEAEDPAEFAKTCPDDGLRPLIKRGRRRMVRTARGLLKLAPKPDLLASSPLKRAAQTARILGRAYGRKPVEIGELSPGRPINAVLRWLRKQPRDATIALVGHEPHLGLLIGWLITGLDEPVLALKKGAAAMLAFPARAPIGPGRARLRWAMTGKQLREVGG